MTPYDFLRSLAPTLADREAVNKNPPNFFHTVDTDGNGLISWEEYLLMVILISVPQR